MTQNAFYEIITVTIIYRLVKEEKQVLICAPSNTACDLLAEKMSLRGVETLRLGNLSRIDPAIVNLSLEEKIACHEQAGEIKKIKRMTADLRKQAGKFKRNFGPAQREERRRLYREARELAKEGVELERYVIRDLLDRAGVICTTLVGARSPYLEGRRFSTCVIDEGAQALEPACWIPIHKAQRIILAGDPCQLPPTIKSVKAQKGGLALTLMERLLDTPGSSSLKNPGECELLVKHLGLLLAEEGLDRTTSIGIISPYKAQVTVLKESLKGIKTFDLTVNTVDSFQGQERDVIYISLVRSNPDGKLGFLSDLRRMNVAMTRAKKKLVILGDSATLTREPFYQALFDYAEETGAYRSAFEFLD